MGTSWREKAGMSEKLLFHHRQGRGRFRNLYAKILFITTQNICCVNHCKKVVLRLSSDQAQILDNISLVAKDTECPKMIRKTIRMVYLKQ